MEKKLSFGVKFIEDTTICDYCMHHKCDWIKTTPKKLPKLCPKPKKFFIADSELPRHIFMERTDTAKKVGIYFPDETAWHFSGKKGGKIHGQELAEVMAEINSWSEKNEFELTHLITYKRKIDRRGLIDEY